MYVQNLVVSDLNETLILYEVQISYTISGFGKTK
jgi:hypothetical protein